MRSTGSARFSKGRSRRPGLVRWEMSSTLAPPAGPRPLAVVDAQQAADHLGEALQALDILSERDGDGGIAREAGPPGHSFCAPACL